MGKYQARVRPAILWVGLGLAVLLVLNPGIKFVERYAAVKRVANLSREANFANEAPRFSKYEITMQLMKLTAQIREFEKDAVRRGPLGVQIYAPAASGRLFQSYQAAQIRLAYLNQGTGALTNKTRHWEGYLFQVERNRPIQIGEIEEALRYLQKYPWAADLLHGFRIFLLPYTIPDVSGLGGVGYNLLSALGNPVETPDTAGTAPAAAAEEIGVTLYHEIGHHLHLSMMPEDTAAGRVLWQKYLRIRGAEWHGPGKVKTQAWSDSSEETFAEDFRMLFGKDQPFYQDVAVGDPRSNPEKAALLRRFMVQLANRPVRMPYQSPWQPDTAAVIFWRLQPLLIGVIWFILGVSYWTVESYGIKMNRSKVDLPFHLAGKTDGA